MLQDFKQITIIGTGLLGGSIGLGLKAAGFAGRIVGFGSRAETLERARHRGCIDTFCEDLPGAVRNSQMAVIATPLSVFPKILGQLAQCNHQEMIVTDVGSTKHGVCQAARHLLPHHERFVGSHPMAGGEQHGPDHARANLFQDKPCIITAEPDTEPYALETVKDMWAQLGMRLVQMSPQDHDRRVAVISHLPHLVAVLMVDLAAKQGGLDVASTGFGDTTRVASGDPGIWKDIFTTNRTAVIEAIDAFSNALADFRTALAESDQDRVIDLLRRSKETRDRWSGKEFDFDRRRSTGSD